jgi:hypothetical protein
VNEIENIKKRVKKIAGMLFILFFAFFTEGYGQSDEVIMDYLMGLEYQIHEDFVLYGKMDCFDSIPKLNNALTCQKNKFNSKDNHVKVFMSVHKPMASEDSVGYARFLPEKAIIPPVNTLHIYQIIRDIRVFYDYTQEEAENRWREYVYYFSTEEAKQICNADTLLSYTLTLDDNESYEGRYKHIAVYYMQKHDRGNLGVYCFYDDEIAKNPEKYMENILGMFSYKEPFTKKTLPEEWIIIDTTPKQKKQPLREDDVLREIIELHENQKGK